MVNFRPRIPDVRRGISGLLDETRRRTRLGLLDSGGEPCLLYLPDGYVDTATWDSTLQRYDLSEWRYRLYLNRHRTPEGNRLYGDDTDVTPSVLVAFPPNPDVARLRDEGLVLSTRVSSWTLWEPDLPPRGAIIRRITTTGPEWYVVSDVTTSWFPDRNKVLRKLHQEMVLNLLTPDFGIDTSRLPTLEDTLSLYANDLRDSTDGLSRAGFVSTDFERGWTELRPPASLTRGGVYLRGRTQIRFSTNSSQTRLTYRWATAVDAAKPSFTIDLGTGQARITRDGTSVLASIPISLGTNTSHLFGAQISPDDRLSLFINGSRVLSYDLRPHPLYSSMRPLAPGAVDLIVEGGSGTSVRLNDYRVMELV